MYSAHLPVLLCTCRVPGPDTASETFARAEPSEGSHASDIPLTPARRGPLSPPRGTAHSHASDGVQAGENTGKRGFNYGTNT